MGWNRPSESGEAISRSLQKRSGDRFPAKGLVAGAIVVLGAGIAAWWLWPGVTPAQQASYINAVRRGYAIKDFVGTDP